MHDVGTYRPNALYSIPSPSQWVGIHAPAHYDLNFIIIIIPIILHVILHWFKLISLKRLY